MFRFILIMCSGMVFLIGIMPFSFALAFGISVNEYPARMLYIWESYPLALILYVVAMMFASFCLGKAFAGKDDGWEELH